VYSSDTHYECGDHNCKTLYKHLMSGTAYITLLTQSTSDLSLTNDAHNLSDTVIAATLIKLTFFFIRIVMMT